MYEFPAGGKVEVILNQFKENHMRKLRLIVLMVIGLSGWAVAAESEPGIFEKAGWLGRGINLGNALEAPSEGAWGVVLEEEFFKIIKDGGFDSIRIPIKFSAHALKEEPYTIDKEFFERVDWAVKNALFRDFTVIVDLHHYDEIYEDPAAHKARFVALWGQIAEHYKDCPEQVFFELLNEPCKNLTDDIWNDLIAEALKVVRKTNPERAVIVGPTHWNNIRQLGKLKVPAGDRNIIVTCHYYEPMALTHQGASWVAGPSESWLGTKWLGSESEKAEIEKMFDIAERWSKKNNRPMFIGEFGTYDRAEMASRVRWTSFVASAARKRNFTLAYWEFCASFGVYDKEKKQWREGLKNAVLGGGVKK